MSALASQIASLTIVCSTVYSGTDQRKHQSSASLAFVLGIHRWPVNSPHKWPVTRKMFPFDDVIMRSCHKNSFEDQVPAHAINRCPFFRWFAGTWIKVGTLDNSPINGHHMPHCTYIEEVTGKGESFDLVTHWHHCYHFISNTYITQIYK